MPAFARSFRPEKDVSNPILGSGQYVIKKEDSFLVVLNKSQRDPAVYGEDSNEFKPERMLEENFDKLPKGAWQVGDDHSSSLDWSANKFQALWNRATSLHWTRVCLARGPDGNCFAITKLQL